MKASVDQLFCSLTFCSVAFSLPFPVIRRAKDACTNDCGPYCLVRRRSFRHSRLIHCQLLSRGYYRPLDSSTSMTMNTRFDLKFLGPLHMSPANWASSVSEISPRHSFLYKNFDVFIGEGRLPRLPRSR